MLPLWRDRLRIGLSPDAVVLLRISKGLRPGISAKHIEKCPPDSVFSWQDALTALNRLLTLEKWKNADAAVTLSSHFVRYLLIPWNAEIKGEQEQMAYVRHRFGKVFGAAAQNWALRYSTSDYGTPALASGIDQALLDGVNLACQAGKLHLRSVQPYLMPVFNRHRHLFKNDSGWLALIEHDKLTLAQCQNQAWQHISTHFIHSDSPAETLAELLERQSHLSGMRSPVSKVFILAPGHSKLDFPHNRNWAVQQLHPQSGLALSLHENKQYALVAGEN